MNFALVLGNETRYFNIGKSKSAASAIEFYATYLLTGDHSKIFTCNQALFELLGENPANEIKIAVCQVLLEHAVYKIKTEQSTYKIFYFINTAQSACMQCNIKVPEDLSNFLMMTLQTTSTKMQENFDPEMAKEAGIALCLAPEKDYDEKNHSYKVDEIEVKDLDERPIIEAEKIDALDRYSRKFFTKNQCPNHGNWKPYAQAKLPQTMRQHDVRFIKFANDDASIVEKFASKLVKHGFTSNIQHYKDSLYLSTDLTRAQPK